MPEDLVIREYQPSDAAGVARMWNDSDSFWPGSFTRGIPFTGPSVAERFASHHRISLLLGMIGDDVAGYCEITEFDESPDIMYVALLNASPRFHNRGVGRDLLKRALALAIERNRKRLDLHTWTGNMRAVPLYKKTGFFWVPETSVHMKNFLPSILKLPAAAEYFRKHDWYTTLVRDLTVQEDLYQERGMRVYPYEWRAGDDHLRVVIDAVGGGVVEMATTSYRVTCQVDDSRLFPGVPQTVRWTIDNFSATPVLTSLHAHGSGGIDIDIHHAGDGAGQQTWSAEFCASEIAGKPAIETAVLIGGQSIALRVEFDAKEVLAYALDPVDMIPVGTPVHRNIVVRNATPWAVDATVSAEVAPGSGLSATWPDRSTRTVHLPSYGRGILPITLRGERTAKGTVRVASSLRVAGGEELRAKDASLLVAAVADGESLAYEDGGNIQLCTAFARCSIALKGGQWTITDALDGQEWLNGRAIAGAPPDGATIERLSYSAHFATTASGAEAVLQARLPNHPEVTFMLTYQLSERGTLSVCAGLSGMKPAEGQAPFHIAMSSGSPRNLPRFAARLKNHFVVGAAPSWPDWFRGEQFLEPSAFKERWIARDDGNGNVAGQYWESDAVVRMGPWDTLGNVRFALDVNSAASHDDIPQANIHYTWGRGDWRAVRAAHAAASGAMLDQLPQAVSALSISTASGGALLEGDAALSVLSMYVRPNPGELQLEAPMGWAVHPRAVAIPDLRFGEHRPVTVTLRRQPDGGPPVALLATTYRGTFLDTMSSIPVLAWGRGAPVAEREQESAGHRCIEVANEHLRFQVAPSFNGSVVSLHVDGDERLRSAFPQPRDFMGFKPWHGGIHPAFALDAPPEYWLEFPRLGPADASLVYGRGASKLWSGVRLVSEPDDHRLKGMAVTTEYLTLPGAPTLAISLSVRNLTNGPLRVAGGASCFQPAGGNGSRTWWDGSDGLSVRSTDIPMFNTWRRWHAISRSPDEATLFVSPSQQVHVTSFGSLTTGMHFGWAGTWKLAPKEEQTAVAYLVWCKESEVAAYASALARGAELP